MDNLTHSLAGALLGQLGLKRRTGLAVPTLVIGANAPDIDAVATLLGPQALAIRRGVTHGPIAMLLLPLVLAGAMLLWARLRGDGGRPVRPRWLLLLAAVAVWSHPALDWLNSYGIRLLEPFSSRWFAADTLFIIDPWVWAALLVALLLSLRLERRGNGRWRRPAVAGAVVILGYVVANGLLSQQAEAITRASVARTSVRPELVVANPVPVRFWQRRMLWRGEGLVGSGRYDVLRQPAAVMLDGAGRPDGMDDRRLAEALRSDPAARAFHFWSRMPMVVEQDGRAYLTDQRFAGTVTASRFVVPLEGQ